MALPASDPNAQWPPQNLQTIFAYMRQWSAWYANDLAKLQAAYGGDKRACQAFNANDWDTSPSSRTVMIEAPLSQWRKVGDMSREERIEKFEKRVRARHDLRHGGCPIIISAAREIVDGVLGPGIGQRSRWWNGRQ